MAAANDKPPRPRNRPPPLVDVARRATRHGVDVFAETQRRAQWADPSWAADQVSDATFRALAFLDAVEVARHDGEFRVALLAGLKALGKGKRGGVQLPEHVRQLEADLITIIPHLIEEDRKRLQAERDKLAVPIYATRAADRELVKTQNTEREQRLTKIDAELKDIDELDPLKIVARHLGKARGNGPPAASTLRRRSPKSGGVE